MTREELIAYDKWLTRRKWGTGEIISPERAADIYLAEHPLPPAEGARKVQWSGYGELGNISQKPLHPTAEGAGLDHQHDHLLDHPEGAEEILEKHMKLSSIQPINGGYPLRVVKIAMREFATLHARKMARENLREELIAYDKWLWLPGHFMGKIHSAEKAVDNYLCQKSKEQ